MIRVFYGAERKKAVEAAQKFLGEGYEIVEGMDLVAGDLPNVFWGNSLLSASRKILVRDILANKAVAEDLPQYLESPHQIAVLEMNVDKRSTIYKKIKDKVEFIECKAPKDFELGIVFDIYKVAKKDGKKAVEMLTKIQEKEDPILFTGLMASQAYKDYATHPGEREKGLLKMLARLDLELKSSQVEPWLLVKAVLLEIGHQK